MLKKYILSPLFAPLSMVLLCSLFLNVIYIVMPFAVPQISEEGQFIDILTYISYSILIFLLLISFKNFKDEKLDYFTYLFLSVCVFLREMGAQHWLTSTDTTAIKIKFFTNPNNPISEKIISGIIILSVLIAILYIAKKYAVYLIKGVFKMDTISWSIGTMVFFGLFSKFIDRLPSNFRREHGEMISEVIKDNLSVLEETSEIFIPLTAILILIQYYLIKRKN